MSSEEGSAYNESSIPFCQGERLPERSIPVQWIMFELWEDMRACDKKLADELQEPVFIFMRAQTSRTRLTVRSLGPYLEHRQGDVGQAYVGF